ncbi:MAG: hypothetical protein QNJ63_29120 [Calothrix sp. MO_192.B10]|nr:hypothetical protein [Calothrix sp. MO_192.B10]
MTSIEKVREMVFFSSVTNYCSYEAVQLVPLPNAIQPIQQIVVLLL